MGLLDELAKLPQEETVIIDELGPVEDPARDPKKQTRIADPVPEKVEKVEDQTEDDAPEDDSEEENPAVEGYRRRKIKDAERDAKTASDRADRLEAQLADITKMMAQGRMPQQPEIKQDNAPQVPDRYEDPDGWVAHMLEQGVNASASVKQQLDELKTQQVFRAAQDELGRLETNYAKSNPKYFEAVEHAMQVEVKRQQFLNPSASESAIRANLERERVQLAAQFQAQGKDPVDSINQFMVNVYGYTPKEPEEEVETPKKTDTFDTVRKNKAKAATGLGSGGQRGKNDILTKETGRRMSVAEFSKLDASQRDQAFGSTI